MRLINQVTTKLCHCFTCICLLWKKKTTLSLEIFTLWDLKRKNSNKVINRNAITIGWRVTGFLHFSVRLMNECDILRSILIESIFLIGKGPRLLYNKQNNNGYMKIWNCSSLVQIDISILTLEEKFRICAHTYIYCLTPDTPNLHNARKNSLWKRTLLNTHSLIRQISLEYKMWGNFTTLLDGRWPLTEALILI